MSTLNKKLTSFFKNGHWGIVNAEGRIIIPACYDAILGFDYNESAHLFLFSVKKGKLWGVIDQNSAVIKSGKTKCDALIKRNVIFSSKTKCNKIKTHTAQKRSI